jgi:hypothetical protein
MARSETCGAHQSVEHNINILKLAERLNGSSAKADGDLSGKLRECGMRSQLLITHNHSFCTKLDRLRDKQLNIAMSGKRHHPHRGRIAARDIEGLASDGAC